MASFGPERFPLKNGDSVAIRSCVPGDATQFERFVRQASRETTNTLYQETWGLSLTRVADRWRRAERILHEAYIGAFLEDGPMVAQLSFSVPEPEHPWIRHVGKFGLLILQEYWGNGLGSRLMEILEQLARDSSVTRIEATVRTRNARALALYDRFGYVIEGTRKNAARVEGNFENEHLIARIL